MCWHQPIKAYYLIDLLIDWCFTPTLAIFKPYCGAYYLSSSITRN